MTDTAEQPQIYLITPTDFSSTEFGEKLGRILDGFDIACLRISLSSTDEQYVSQSTDVLRDICHARDVPVVIDQHYRLVQSHGLDGVHINDNAAQLRDIRKELSADAIIGSYCGNSRHVGLTAGEIGADYVSFGPVGESSLGTGNIAANELFEWWSQMVEIPVVAEGSMSLECAEKLAPVADFLALGDEIWTVDDPIKELAKYVERIR